jgi:transcriptional regulator with XRE-family HTH domain
VKDAPDPIDKYVGARVRARRIGLRMSQTTLGKAIGVTFQQIQKYENGTNRIGASNLYRICQALSVDVAFLFTGLDGAKALNAAVPRERQAAAIADPTLSDEAIKLVHNYSRIESAEVRQRLFLFVRSLAGS